MYCRWNDYSVSPIMNELETKVQKRLFQWKWVKNIFFLSWIKFITLEGILGEIYVKERKIISFWNKNQAKFLKFDF